MRMELKMLLGVAGLMVATQAAAQVTFYEGEAFRGRFLTADGTVPDFYRYGFNDRAASAVVSSGRWEACEDVGFQGRCMILRPGSYSSLAATGLSWRISSVRPVADARVGYEAPPPVVVTAPPPAVVTTPAPVVAAPTYVRPEDQRFEARVISVRAILGAPGQQQQCWMEKEKIGPLELPGAIIGSIGDALAGKQRQTYFEHCDTVPTGAQLRYWDVTYQFRGVERHAQLAAAPGPTIAVNGNGEPIA